MKFKWQIDLFKIQNPIKSSWIYWSSQHMSFSSVWFIEVTLSYLTWIDFKIIKTSIYIYYIWWMGMIPDTMGEWIIFLILWNLKLCFIHGKKMLEVFILKIGLKSIYIQDTYFELYIRTRGSRAFHSIFSAILYGSLSKELINFFEN